MRDDYWQERYTLLQDAHRDLKSENARLALAFKEAEDLYLSMVQQRDERQAENARLREVVEAARTYLAEWCEPYESVTHSMREALRKLDAAALDGGKG